MKIVEKSKFLVGRLTAKKLISWINEQFEKIEINNFEAFEITPTRFNSDQIEGGAALNFIRVRSKLDNNQQCTMLLFYRIKQLEWYIKNGYYLKLSASTNIRWVMISDLTIDVVKTK